MLKDIRIKITNKQDIDNIIFHAMDLGYPVNGLNVNLLRRSDYILVTPKKAMIWCDEERFITALNYEEMSVDEFIDYKGNK